MSSAELQHYLETHYARIMGCTDAELSIDDYAVIEMVVSKCLIERMDATQVSEQCVSYLIPAHKEFYRLKTKAEVFTGENFLREKVRQLEFLFENCHQFKWNLVFVDDQAREGNAPRTIDAIQEQIATDSTGILTRNQHRIILLDYERDLQEERSAYGDPALRNLSADDFARQSVKGGAVQTGLRYLAHVVGGNKAYKVPRADVIMYTDCDLSVNLAGSGVLLDDIYAKKSDVVIGSRRVRGAHIVKSEGRNVLSTAFNALVSHALNLPFADTQAGAKMMRTEVVERIHTGFHDVGMSFDVELLKLASEHLTLSEKGIVWIDSDIESQSEGMGPEMFQGVIRTIQRQYPRLDISALSLRNNADISEEQQFSVLADAMSQEESFDAVLKLAVNPQWQFIMRHVVELYQAASPKDFKDFISHLNAFFIGLANNTVTEKDIQDIVNSITSLVQNFQPMGISAFVLKTFPELRQVAEMVMRNPHYIKVLTPLLCGDGVVTKVVSSTGHPSFGEYQVMNPDIEGHRALFTAWARKQGNLPEIAVENKERKSIPVNESRIQSGVARLANLSTQEPKTIAIVMQFNQNNTNVDYVKRILIQKMDALKQAFDHLPHIHWKLCLVDARTERKNDMAGVVLEIVKAYQGSNVSGELLLAPDKVHEKASAVRFGMSEAAKTSDVIGFIDFSDKIDIREMGNLVANILSQPCPSVAIGSRRMEESEVENKPLLMVMRSAMLNLVVRTTFPHLAHLSDTQTGFKLFSTEVWEKISTQPTQCNGIGFDIELLQQAARFGYAIQESPVDFYDNMQNRNIQLNESDSAGIFQDILTIRTRLPDTPLTEMAENEARLLAGGAENVVYQLKNGSILKIPHEVADPDFTAVVKEVVFKHRKAMTAENQQERVVDSAIMQAVLNSEWLKHYIPQLRNWQDFNVLVMKTIAAFEQKDYKSIGYQVSEVLGCDVIIPFRFVRESFSLTINGKEEHFTGADDIKQSVFAHDTFKGRLSKILEGTQTNEEKKRAIKQLLDEGTALFQRLWMRGLFDLDTNMMCDTGFYPNSAGKETLMVLDPGEIVSDFALLNVELVRKQITQRYDYKEMDAVFSQYFSAGEVDELLQHHRRNMEIFLDYTSTDRGRSDFASDQRSTSPESLRIIFNQERYLLPASTQLETVTRSQKKRKALALSKVGYQLPYRETDELPAMVNMQANGVPFIHIISEGSAIHDTVGGEESLTAKIGSIVPTLDALCEHVFEGSQNQLIILDAGTATRSSLLKMAKPGASKGSIMVGGQPLYQSAASSLAPLVKALPNGMVVMSSSDDVMAFSDEDIAQIVSYFGGDNAPGMYWCELPNAGREIFPLTVVDTQAYLEHYADIPALANAFLGNIPFARGAIEKGDAATLAFKALTVVSHALMSSSTQEVSSKGSGVVTPGVEMATDYYRQFLQYHALTTLGGSKTPFLMVFKKEFLKEFQETIVPLLPAYTHRDITWESVLLRGLKADKTIWMQSGKPYLMENQQWEEIYDKIQSLKQKYNIDTHHVGQNEARVFRGKWQNFDDPYALFSYITHAYPAHVQYGSNITVHSDNNTAPQSITCDRLCTIGAVHSDIKGTVHVKQPEGVMKKREVECYTLFYNVHLAASKTLEVMPNHLVVGIGNEIYAIAMHPMTKETLKDQMVYCFTEEGKPEAYKPFNAFAKEQASQMPNTEVADIVSISTILQQENKGRGVR